MIFSLTLAVSPIRFYIHPIPSRSDAVGAVEQLVEFVEHWLATPPGRHRARNSRRRDRLHWFGFRAAEAKSLAAVISATVSAVSGPS